ncbi:DUF2155 domain-containing protein [Novosphingobium sp. PC22D]|uniref:DUF2155 domain-containing protein n=1 Tax=Novosphingobium sp. PC22D TaxID=1962403 RepID=UPI001F0B5089|nr:DUF2155 domain-containing protein [Novosphingobium sp. PC22D]
MRRAAALALIASLAGCGGEPPPPTPEETGVPDALVPAPKAPGAQGSAGIGTPMKERVATLGVLNKRNNLEQDFTMKPGESRRLGNLVVRLSACEKTAPWEKPEEEGAFVQVFVQERARSGDDAVWHKVFSGWLFKNSPALNVVEHPIYDVWVKSCAMSFPGEEDSPSDSASDNSEA